MNFELFDDICGNDTTRVQNSLSFSIDYNLLIIGVDAFNYFYKNGTSSRIINTRYDLNLTGRMLEAITIQKCVFSRYLDSYQISIL